MPVVAKHKETESKDGFPVKHYSPSSMIAFGANPVLFKINYINGDYFETADSAASVLGKAFHKAMEAYYGGVDEFPVGTEAEAIEAGLKVGTSFLEMYNDGYINYSTNLPTKQALLEKFAYAFNEYVKEMPYENGEELVAIEHGMEHAVAVNWRGENLVLPVKLKGYADKIFRKDGKVKIKDYKTCHAFSDLEKIDGAKIIQAVVYYLLAYAETGEEPYSMVYEEVKYTKNKEGGSQVRSYEMVFGDNDQYFDFFFRYYDDMTRALSGEQVYVPNVRALFDNEVAMVAYIHRLDESEETAKLMKKHKVQNITDLLKKKVQSAKTMRKLMEAVDKQFISAKTLNYDKMQNYEKIQAKLMEHGMIVNYDSKIEGASVDLYRYTPSVGLKMSKIGAYIADIEQVLGVSGIRALAPIPDTSLVGFEVPRKQRKFPKLPKHHGGFDLAIGETVDGDVYRFDIREAPHMIIAGSSGSGKSVFLGNLIRQLVETPNVDLYLYDPKKVELSAWEAEAKEYQDTKNDIRDSLAKLVTTMQERYEKMKAEKVKNIADLGRYRYKVVVIDEFAEIAMSGLAGEYIQSLAQMGRAAGIHLIIATQRASTRIINGDTKVNFPVKAVFKMAKVIDSQVMLDEAGAEKLLGKGDMLFASDAGTIRLQGYNGK